MVGHVEGLHALDLVDGALLQMVLQIAADTLLVQHRRNAELGQPVGWPDAGELQDLR